MEKLVRECWNCGRDVVFHVSVSATSIDIRAKEGVRFDQMGSPEVQIVCENCDEMVSLVLFKFVGG